MLLIPVPVLQYCSTGCLSAGTRVPMSTVLNTRFIVRTRVLLSHGIGTDIPLCQNVICEAIVASMPWHGSCMVPVCHCHCQFPRYGISCYHAVSAWYCNATNARAFGIGGVFVTKTPLSSLMVVFGGSKGKPGRSFELPNQNNSLHHGMICPSM